MQLGIVIAALSGVIATFAAAVVLNRIRVRRWVRRELNRLETFAAEIGGRLQSPEPLDLFRSRVRGGSLEGRKVWVELGSCKPGEFRVRLGVDLDPQLRLKIQVPSLMGRLQRALGSSAFVKTGDPELDGRLLITSDRQVSARRLFVHGGEELLEIVGELLQPGRTEEVVADQGWLYLDCLLPDLDPRYLRWVLNRMVKAARFYERKPIKIRWLQAERFAWTGGGKQSLCPYCREEVAEAQADLVACESCQTLHHEECFDEHGGCTIYGCGGASKELLRHRA